MLYTKKGDGGASGLYGTYERFKKSDQIYDALGSVDELNTLLGLYRARTSSELPELTVDIEQVQEILFIVQAELAGAPKAVTATHIKSLECAIDLIEHSIDDPHSFILPGSTEHSALFDHARAVARRAEREVLKVDGTHAVSQEARTYLNRLSSFLYALARYAAIRKNVSERTPSYELTQTTYE